MIDLGNALAERGGASYLFFQRGVNSFLTSLYRILTPHPTLALRPGDHAMDALNTGKYRPLRGIGGPARACAAAYGEESGPPPYATRPANREPGRERARLWSGPSPATTNSPLFVS